MESRSQPSHLNDQSLDTINSQRRAMGLRPITGDQWRRMELDRKMTDIEPGLRRHILRDQLGMWIIAFVVFAIVAPMVFGGVGANGATAILILIGFSWWAWRSWRQRNTDG